MDRLSFNPNFDVWIEKASKIESENFKLKDLVRNMKQLIFEQDIIISNLAKKATFCENLNDEDKDLIKHTRELKMKYDKEIENLGSS